MLKQQDAIVAGLAVSAVVIGIHSVSLPTAAGVRASAPGNGHVDSARRGATLIAVIVVVGASLLAKDPTVFVIGGPGAIALPTPRRLPNAPNNKSGKIPSASSAAPVPAAA